MMNQVKTLSFLRRASVLQARQYRSIALISGRGVAARTISSVPNAVVGAPNPSFSVSSTSLRHHSTKAKKAPAPAAETETAASQLSTLTEELPYLDVVRYTHKQRVWSLQHVHYYSEALAIGLVENGLQPGDVVLSWLPDHFSEQMVLQFACAKSGLILYTLDPHSAVTDRAASQQALQAALTLTKANVLVSQEAGNDVNYVNMVHEIIPELLVFDFALGMPFLTPRFPHLRFCIQTGFDQDDKLGWLPLRHMVVPSDNLSDFVAPERITANTPLAGQFTLNDKGIPTGIKEPMTNSQVLQSGVWPTFSKILKKEYHEVEGVGVVF